MRCASVVKSEHEHIASEAVEIVCNQIAGATVKHEALAVRRYERLERERVAGVRAGSIYADKISFPLYDVAQKHIHRETVGLVRRANEIICKTLECDVTAVIGDCRFERSARRATRACKIHADQRLCLSRDV